MDEAQARRADAGRDARVTGIMGNGRSARHLRERLSGHEDAIKAYTGDLLYHVQIDFTCQLLEAVDEVTDEVTATMIVDTIYERLTGDGVSAAAERIRESRAKMQELARMPWPPTGFPDR